MNALMIPTAITDTSPLAAALVAADWTGNRPLPELFKTTPVAAVRAEIGALRARLNGTTPPADAGRAVAFLLTHFPAVSPPDPDGYLTRLEEAAAEYPPSVVEATIRTLGRTAKFAPSVQELVETLDAARDRLGGLVSRLALAARDLDYQIEQARRTLEAHPVDTATQGRFQQMEAGERAAAVKALREEAARLLDMNGIERPRTRPPVEHQARAAGWENAGLTWGYDQEFHDALKRFDEHWTTGRPLADIVKEWKIRQHHEDAGVEYLSL